MSFPFINDSALKKYIDDIAVPRKTGKTADDIKAREANIKELTALRNKLIVIENYIADKVNDLEKEHHGEIQEIIDIVKPRLQSSPALIGPNVILHKKIEHVKTAKKMIPVEISSPDSDSQPLTLDAVPITSLAEAADYPGILMYMASWNHFVVNVSGVIAHGNVGNIFNRSGEHARIRDCWNGKKCPHGNSCTYYHDPELFQGSTHIRNYTNYAWMYDPASVGRGDNSVYRKIGSRDNLERDLSAITHIDAIRMSNQLVHDFVTYALIRKYKK